MNARIERFVERLALSLVAGSPAWQLFTFTGPTALERFYARRTPTMQAMFEIAKLDTLSDRINRADQVDPADRVKALGYVAELAGVLRGYVNEFEASRADSLIAIMERRKQAAVEGARF